jgi:hypothetical protein
LAAAKFVVVTYNGCNTDLAVRVYAYANEDSTKKISYSSDVIFTRGLSLPGRRSPVRVGLQLIDGAVFNTTLITSPPSKHCELTPESTARR